MSKIVLFYSSVKTKKMFSVQSYYRNDILILKDLGYKVSLSNTVFDFLLFWKYDVSFLYFYRYSLIAAFFSKCLRKKVYFTGGIDALDKNVATYSQRFIQQALFRICKLLSTRCILVSTSDMQNVRSIYDGTLPSKCELSFHVIDMDQFCLKGTTVKKNQFLTIAWMVSVGNVFRKGVDKAIRIFSSFVKENCDYKFYIAGPSGAGSEFVENLIRELNLESFVFYLGIVTEEEKIKLLEESRYYFQLSIYEGFGIAAMEALAAGCQVIHSGRGGLRDGIGDFGYQVDIDDEDAICRLMLELCAQEKDVDHLNKGFQYVKQNFSYQTRLNCFRVILR